MEKGDRTIYVRYPATISVLNFFRGILGLPKLFQVSASYPASLAETVKHNHGINIRKEVKIALKEEHIKMLEKRKTPTEYGWDEIKRR